MTLKIDLNVKNCRKMAPIVLNNFHLNSFFVFGLPTEIFRCVD